MSTFNYGFNTLTLSVKPGLYDRIYSNEINELYKPIKTYWCKRLKGFAKVCKYSLPTNIPGVYFCQIHGSDCESTTLLEFDKICIKRGKTNRSMTFNIEKISVGYGNVEWGATMGEFMFIIKLGERLDDEEKA